MFHSIERLTPILFLAAGWCAASLSAGGSAGSEDKAETEARMRKNVSYLASRELEGRGVGTKGLDLAAEMIRQEFQRLGLKTDLIKGSPYQEFEMPQGARLGEGNSLVLAGPPQAGGAPGKTLELKVGEDFNPLAIGGSSSFRLPIVFAGYGITGRNENYDDYAQVDVKGKAVIVLRHEPRQNDPQSAFSGTTPSAHATFQSKIKNAQQHGAGLVIVCTDEEEIRRFVKIYQRQLQGAIDALLQAETEFKKLENPTREQLETHRQNIDRLAEQVSQRSAELAAQYDPLADLKRAGVDNVSGDLPVVFVRREALDKMLTASLGKSLSDLERAIDEGPTPQSAELTGWMAQGRTDIVHAGTPVRNVIGVLEGEGPHADETIIIGAHYDHVGWGEYGSLAGVRAIHHGADDNGSGTTTLLEVARLLTSRGKKPPRRIVFIAFTAEELGLIGSFHYIKNPVFPLDKTVAMINLDMVGRMRDNKVLVYGVGTSPRWSSWLDKINQGIGLELVKKKGSDPDSDHYGFFAQKVPILFFFTGEHPQYHRPTDTADLLNITGMRQIAEITAGMVGLIADTPERPPFTAPGGNSEEPVP